MPGPAIYRSIDDLPRTIAIFPLPLAILLPRARLPLNIFEPRYLAMIDDALATSRVIGMIQPSGGGEKPALFPVGCLGRITSFTETPDNRYLITLTGLARFRAGPEAANDKPYRRMEVDYAPYASDMAEPAEDQIDRLRLIDALRDYLRDKSVQLDWDAVERAPAEQLVNAIAMLSPFDPTEKQAILEAKDFRRRGETVLALLEIGARGGGGQSVQ
ncbi:MAG: peptidase S16 [Alphaproteobacteria bacterium]|nr:peptidase S16 [Alphaproteobacteria bacterium]